MKQVLQYVDSGKLEVADVPTPAAKPGGVLVRTSASLISAGTEKMMVDLGRKSLLGKARARPDLVKQVVDKARKEGVLNTVQAVRARLEEPLVLGYSAAGQVIEVGAGVTDLHVGDRVAIAGAGYANHAEVNFVPRNLAAVIPPTVSYEEGAYTTVASIALHGVRLANPCLGDSVVVIGLGLVGLVAVQLLNANGCHVFGVDLDPAKVELARVFGAEAIAGQGEEVVRAIEEFTGGRGADSVVIAASASSSGPVELAGTVSRRRARVVVVGAVGMSIPRDVYYSKEISLRVSMSYGPGRYDTSYEEDGVDYPYEFVRWTENRNMQAILALLDQKKLNFSALTTHRFGIQEAVSAYKMIEETSDYVGVLLEYDTGREVEKSVDLRPGGIESSLERLRIGFIGAGNYATLQLLPRLQRIASADLHTLVTATGASAKKKAEKFGFSSCTTDAESVFESSTIDAVFIATRHSTHAELTVRALDAGKHVFVEKPLAVNEEQLESIERAFQNAHAVGPLGLMVGLNRRFSPMVKEIKGAFASGGPLVMLYRVNAGHIPIDAWVYDDKEGGGMLVGESCHFFDVMNFVSGSRPVEVSAASIRSGRSDISDRDNLTVVVSYENGSVGTLVYTTVGSKSASKERLEVFGSGKVAFLDDFRRLTLVKDGTVKKMRSRNQDKGQRTQLEETVRMFRSGSSPTPFEDHINVMKTVFAAQRSLLHDRPIRLWE